MRAKAQICAVLATALFAMPVFAQDTFRDPESKVDVDDWSLECFLHTDGSPEACQAYHRVLMNNATQIALVAAFALPAEGEGILYQISLPLGIDLVAGVTLTVDIGYSVKLPVTRCTMQGCLLEGRLTNAPFDALMSGSVSTLTVQIPGQGALAIPMSLNGFSKSIRRIEAAARPTSTSTEPANADTTVSENRIVPNSDTDPDLGIINLDQINDIDPALAPVTGVEK